MKISPLMYAFGVKYKVKKESEEKWKALYLKLPKRKDFKTKEAAEKAFAKAKLDPDVYEVYPFSRIWF